MSTPGASASRRLSVARSVRRIAAGGFNTGRGQAASRSCSAASTGSAASLTPITSISASCSGNASASGTAGSTKCTTSCSPCPSSRQSSGVFADSGPGSASSKSRGAGPSGPGSA